MKKNKKNYSLGYFSEKRLVFDVVKSGPEGTVQPATAPKKSFGERAGEAIADMGKRIFSVFGGGAEKPAATAVDPMGAALAEADKLLGPAQPDGAAAAAPAAAPAQPAQGAAPGEGAKAPEAKSAVTEATVKDLEALKGEFGKTGDLNKFLETTRLTEVSRVFDFPELKLSGEELLKSDAFKGKEPIIADAFLSVINLGDFTEYAKRLKVSPDDLKKLTANLFAAYVAKNVQDKFRTTYPKFDQFLGKNPTFNKYKLKYNFKFDLKGNVQVSDFAWENTTGADALDLQTAFDQFHAEQIAAAAPVDAAKKLLEDTSKAAVEKLAKTPIAGILKVLGYNTPEKMAQVANGEDILGSFLIWIFGYEDYMKPAGSPPDEKGFISGIIDWFPDTYKDMVMGYKTKADEMSLSYKKWQAKTAASGQAVAGAPAKAPGTPSIDSIDVTAFGEAVEKGSYDFTKARQLAAEYKVEPGKTVKVTLGENGVMELPAGTEVTVNGETVKVPTEKSKIYLPTGSEKGQLEIAGGIPSGTVFTGKVSFA